MSTWTRGLSLCRVWEGAFLNVGSSLAAAPESGEQSSGLDHKSSLGLARLGPAEVRCRTAA